MAGGKRNVLWSPAAERDLSDIWAYLAREASPDKADRQLRDIDAACRDLVEWPLRGRPRGEFAPGLRSTVVSPHVVFYRLSKRAIEVVRVLHGRRDIDTIFTDAG